MFKRVFLKTVRKIHSIGILLLAAAFITPAPVVFAQGYQGLFAPVETPEVKNNKKPAPETIAPQQNDGYSGLVAPSPAPKKSAKAKKDEVPATGFIPGTTIAVTPAEKAPEKNETKQSTAVTAAASQMTPDPKNLPRPPIRSATDLEKATLFSKLKFNDFGVDQVVKDNLDLFAKPLEKTKGQTSLERMVDKKIKSKMGALNDKNLTPEERKKIAQESYASLLDTADGIMLLGKVNVSNFTKAEAPESLIAAQKQSDSNALSQLEKALRAIKPLTQ
jgi:hypothetical protein